MAQIRIESYEIGDKFMAKTGKARDEASGHLATLVSDGWRIVSSALRGMDAILIVILQKD